MIKIKVRPEDFIVEEIADLPFQTDGDFCVYLLKKRGWNTVDILKMLSKKFTVPYSHFSYGGKKDKYALTAQYITIARKSENRTLLTFPRSSERGNKDDGSNSGDRTTIARFFTEDNAAKSNLMARHKYPVPVKVDEENYSLSFVGAMNRHMGPDLIKGNRFHLVVRNLTENELMAALSQIECVKKDGYPNYFDDQRFGSYDTHQGFVAEKILRKHYNGALKIYFSRIHPEDSKEEKEHRKFFRENWGNWPICLKGARNRFEKESFSYLQKDPKGFIPILQRISHEEMVLFFSAYQSHLWNEVLRKIIRSVSNDNFIPGNSEGKIPRRPTSFDSPGTDTRNDTILHSGKPCHSERSAESHVKISRGITGDYLFYIRLDDGGKAYLSTLVIPMPASNIRMPDAFTENLYAEVLQENNVKSPMFNIRKLRQAFFKGIERRAIVTPEDLSVDSAEDEIYHGKKKLILKFFLPRGCYGTMFIKRLLC
ncbi:MAG: tRNA pseudouridine(13) synthase TruD [Candidatus Brocadia sp.]|nr:tRNA pseudouridine(13) synthase TruD [Candidatus Brocadia sp.]MDG6026425.1 tRNA pseudouridine(13) synthase TruD [Candidatus Brocadia sp.]